MTVEERGEQLCQELTQVLMGHSLITGIAVPMITQAIKCAVEEANGQVITDLEAAIDIAVAEEREACAKIVDDFPDYYDNNAEIGEQIAVAIRSRK